MNQPHVRAPRVLLVAATTGYQTRSFGAAAAALGADLAFATDRCHRLDDPWRDRAVPIRFHEEDAAVRAIVDSTAAGPIDAVVAVGDRPALIAALAARALALPAHAPEAVRVAGNKLMTRVRLHEAGMPVPAFRSVPAGGDPSAGLDGVGYPCVVKPLVLAASRGVIRADDRHQLESAVSRVRRLLAAPDIRVLRDPANDAILVEEYIDGPEVAVEGVVTDGVLQVFTTFGKPDPLDGPFFEETVYVTPAGLSEFDRRRVVRAVTRAVRAIGLSHGPVHAECRLSPRGIVVLEVGARPIGGLCSRVLRFDGPGGVTSLEGVLLRHALGWSVGDYTLAPGAAAVMMIPVPRAGVYKRVSGLEAARDVPLIESIVMTVTRDQRLVPWPEGASYPGFIFARGDRADGVVAAVRAAHARLVFDVVNEIPVGPEPG